MIDGWGISCKIALICVSLDFIDGQSTLAQVMAWCRQATSHYSSQCWPRSLSPYGVTRPQWVNVEYTPNHFHLCTASPCKYFQNMQQIRSTTNTPSMWYKLETTSTPLDNAVLALVICAAQILFQAANDRRYILQWRLKSPVNRQLV